MNTNSATNGCRFFAVGDTTGQFFKLQGDPNEYVWMTTDLYNEDGYKYSVSLVNGVMRVFGDEELVILLEVEDVLRKGVR